MTGVGDLIAERYRVVARIGSGSMGVVWRATDELLRRDVAVKELLLQPGITEEQADEARRRAMREGRITARLHHPNAITVYDVAEHDGRPCLVMQYVPSVSLADRLAERTTLPVADVATIGQQVAAALAAAHQAGIVHRDVKPGNVLLTEDGTAKLTDFGISRAVGDGTVTATGVLAGTPAYLAPEVVHGQQADFRSDVFSLGATLYAAVEGVPPFGLSDNPIALLHKIATEEITPPTKAGDLAKALDWMLKRDPAARPTMGQAMAALGIAGGEIVFPPNPMRPGTRAGDRRHRTLRSVIIALVVIAAAVLLTTLPHRGGGGRPGAGP
ncbi:MAG TPA: serine/threonine-protein kinase, partial [Pseudonocardiaceae bacterium]|nr:serine/threonine-protein kinase [Pseudonocardiaceae bacterium]